MNNGESRLSQDHYAPSPNPRIVVHGLVEWGNALCHGDRRLATYRGQVLNVQNLYQIEGVCNIDSNIFVCDLKWLYINLFLTRINHTSHIEPILFIFSHFDWICCNGPQGVCLCVCVCVCVSVCMSVCVSVCLYSPKRWTDFDENFHKSPTIHLLNMFFSDFENSNLMTS